ncbi:hypothetical protein C8R44DRAFT_871579 [Mycena epipterygia]|nr:hypothetical protein C8R44DRAFT_871579 [Mycena epipterygia]
MRVVLPAFVELRPHRPSSLRGARASIPSEIVFSFGVLSALLPDAGGAPRVHRAPTSPRASPAARTFRSRFFWRAPRPALFPDAGGAPRVRGAPTSPPTLVVVEGSARVHASAAPRRILLRVPQL